MILSQHRKKTQMPFRYGSDHNNTESTIPFHSHYNLFNDGDLLEHSTTATGSLWSMDISPEKSLEDCNHKWITADTRVPDGGEDISICINEGETLWAVYHVIKKNQKSGLSKK